MGYGDSNKLRSYINENYDIKELYLAITGRHAGTGKIFCPCHQNTNTPAAKIYDNSIKCFGECNRFYTPYDLMVRFFPDEVDKIKKTIVVPDTVYVESTSSYVLNRSQIDFSQPLESIITQVLKANLRGYKTPTEVFSEQLSNKLQ